MVVTSECSKTGSLDPVSSVRKIMRVHRFRAAIGVIALVLSIPIHAEDEKALEPVQILGVRDPDAFDVAKGLTIQRTFDSIAEVERNKIRLSFVVQTRDGSPAPADIGLSLYTDNGAQPLSRLASGDLVLPQIDDADAKGAEVIASVKRGTLKIVYYVQPRLPTGPMTIGYLRASLVQARNAWRKLYGPLLGWSVPIFTCAGAVFSKPTVVSVRSGSAEPDVVWRSEAASKVEIPLRQPGFRDESIVDWGSASPLRIGGCVKEVGTGNQ